MALQGKLILNEADYATFNLYSVGVFMAHSGRGVYRNKAACSAVVKDGPLPPGKYWNVDRNEENWFSQKGREIKDMVNKVLPVALTTLTRKISKIIYFILLFLVLGRALPRPEIYLDYDIARDICHFLFGSVNADTMYDTFFYISLIIVIFLSAVLYIITLQLISTIRSK
ncbi:MULTISPECIES: tlde1 domain-containing protein [unclassified Klebsiella]|uniref:tlde1 domain-containing protein n=1 Tax=Klebsiella sp. C-Nf10 TaxID=2054605 RepID=UPI001D0CF427|nr:MULTISPECIES: tlde1 domain-containing protein [unclassified Klebsiella]